MPGMPYLQGNPPETRRPFATHKHPVSYVFGIKWALSSAWHSSTDGQTERANDRAMLRTYIQSREEEWPDHLPALELAHDRTSHSAGLYRHEAMLGESPPRPQDLDMDDVFPRALTFPITKAFRILGKRASAHPEQAKRDHKAFPDASRRPHEFSAGGRAWVSTCHNAARECPKFQQRHIGLYRIL
ncbi:hypothetical protein Esti_006057 [Eimeria stiedai]